MSRESWALLKEKKKECTVITKKIYQAIRIIKKSVNKIICRKFHHNGNKKLTTMNKKLIQNIAVLILKTTEEKKIRLKIETYTCILFIQERFHFYCHHIKSTECEEIEYLVLMCKKYSNQTPCFLILRLS